MEERVEDGQNRSTPLPGRSTADDASEALAHPIRRAVLVVLAERDRDGLFTLAEAVGVRTPVDHDETELRIGLHHNHLPKLDAAGAIEYDDRENAVELTAQGAVLAADLEN